MRNSPKLGFLILVGLSVAPCAGAASARHRPAAHARTQAGRTAAPTAARSQAVVAGVVDKIVDGVWEHGDYYYHNGRYTDRIATDRLVIVMDPTSIEAYGTAGW